MPAQPEPQRAHARADRRAIGGRTRHHARGVARLRLAQRSYGWTCRQCRALRGAGPDGDPDRGGERSERGRLCRCRAAARGCRPRPGDPALAGTSHGRGRGRDPGELHELLYRQRSGGGSAIWRCERRSCGRGGAGVVSRPRCIRAPSRPHPDRGRKLPLHLATGSRMSKVTVAALQLAFSEDSVANIRAVSDLVREAAAKGAEVVLPPELFEGPYFCRVEDEALFANARPASEHPAVLAMQELAKELAIWIPTSFFEADGPHHYNSLAMVGPDGKVAGVYRKSHIPDGPGYEEKFYFRPGNTGFKVWNGPHKSTLGVGVCWDQWYPETARAMMLMGADILFYPTAIGTEPHDPDLDTSRLWRRAMIGHAVSNVVPVVAANRIGTEGGQRFYGHSFICDERGDMLAEFGAEETGALVATLDLGAAKKHRAAFGFFRDRRPELYGRLVEDV